MSHLSPKMVSRSLLLGGGFLFALFQSANFIIQTHRLLNDEVTKDDAHSFAVQNQDRKLHIHNSSSNTTRASMSLELPYYMYGKYDFYKHPQEPRKTLLRHIYEEQYKAVEDPNVTTWVLPLLLQHATRNHDSVILEGNNRWPILVTLLGRHCRYIQWQDLETGEQGSKRTEGEDPSGNPIDDLNHVSAVLVDSLNNTGQQEIWLPCGFHGDAVNNETSTDYVRIVNTSTMEVRVGPKLPIAGGACISKALSIIPDEPPMICSFAGTQGNHDRGIFLPDTQCYDRLRERWWSPFGKLPYGLDHGSLAVVPAGTCHEKDPARILIFNFRTRPYGNPHPEFLAQNLPKDGWSLDTLQKYESNPPNEWYVYHNVTDTSHLKDVPRDASGVVMANNGRYILNFGGTYRKKAVMRNGKLSTRGRTSMIRAFDVCEKEWSVVGDLGFQTFALQTAASEQLGVTVTCGGEAPLRDTNSPFCFVSRFDNMTLSNPQSSVVAAVRPQSVALKL